MSKPIVRVVVAVLICLAVIVAVSPGVQARIESVFQKADSNNSADTITEYQPLEQETAEEQPSSTDLNEFGPSDSSRECNSDPSADY